MKVKVLVIQFEDTIISRRDIPKVRGYIAETFPEYIELHNHNGDEGFIYRYPLIQYKAVEGIPYLIGIDKGVDILADVETRLEYLKINEKTIEAFQRCIHFREEKFGIENGMLRYRFITPWMALNQKNFIIYRQGTEKDKTELLKKVLVGNLLSMSKYLGYRVEDTIQPLIHVKPLQVNFKNQKMIAFKGEFLVNFCIPNFWGIGKSVSRGFGTVKQMGEDLFF